MAITTMKLMPTLRDAPRALGAWETRIRAFRICGIASVQPTCVPISSQGQRGLIRRYIALARMERSLVLAPWAVVTSHLFKVLV